MPQGCIPAYKPPTRFLKKCEKAPSRKSGTRVCGLKYTKNRRKMKPKKSKQSKPKGKSQYDLQVEREMAKVTADRKAAFKKQARITEARLKRNAQARARAATKVAQRKADLITKAKMITNNPMEQEMVLEMIEQGKIQKAAKSLSDYSKVVADTATAKRKAALKARQSKITIEPMKQDLKKEMAKQTKLENARKARAKIAADKLNAPAKARQAALKKREAQLQKQLSQALEQDLADVELYIQK